MIVHLKYFGAILLVAFLLTGCSSNEKNVRGKKMQLKVEGPIQEGDWIKFDDVMVVHLLPDTTKKYDPRQFNPPNVMVVDEKDGLNFSMAPSNTVIPLSKGGKWGNFTLPKGMIVSSWINCLALNQKISGSSSFKLDMPNYFSYEGILIIERQDSSAFTISYSKTLPVLIEVLK